MRTILRHSSLFILLLIAGLRGTALAQTTNAAPSYTVTDSLPVYLNGLVAGYKIKKESEKEVGKKGNFSRYSIDFYITNNSDEAKIILYRQGLNLLKSDVSSTLVRFNCRNATGARFTSKEVTLSAGACIIPGIPQDKDAQGKNSDTRHPVKIGYWLKPHETVTAGTVMIVPLDQRLDMTATFYPDQSAMIGSATPGTPLANVH